MRKLLVLNASFGFVPSSTQHFVGEMLWDFLSLVFSGLSKFPFQLHLNLPFLITRFLSEVVQCSSLCSWLWKS